MALSKHEENVLKQIESSLSEDEFFVKAVKGVENKGRKTNFGYLFLFGAGFIALTLGLFIPIKLGDLPIISLIGFLVMFLSLILFFLKKTDSVKSINRQNLNAKNNLSIKLKPSNFFTKLAEKFDERFR